MAFTLFRQACACSSSRIRSTIRAFDYGQLLMQCRVFQSMQHSRLDDTYNDLDGAVVETNNSGNSSYNDLRLAILKGCNYQINIKPWESSSGLLRHATGNVKVYDSLYSVKGKRTFAMQAKSPPQMKQNVCLHFSLVSPGIIMDPYKPRERISFFQRYFTRTGWRRTKEDLISQIQSAYAIAKLRKLTGYSKPKFYEEAIQQYKEINNLLVQGDRTSLRKLVTENMYSIFKNEIKQRERTWSRVHWEMIEPAVTIRTLQARLIGVDKNDLDKVFVQLTLEFLTNQRFAAYDLQGKHVAGDKDAKVLVRDIWVFERSLFQPGARWRLCGRISL